MSISRFHARLALPLAVVVACATLSGISAAQVDPVIVNHREIASYGPGGIDGYVVETGIAVSNNYVFVVHDHSMDPMTHPVDDRVPLEYPGIATFANEVWVSFAGTDVADTTPDKTVIYVAKIQF